MTATTVTITQLDLGNTSVELTLLGGNLGVRRWPFALKMLIIYFPKIPEINESSYYV